MFWAACTACTAISIHAPREGSDANTPEMLHKRAISIHAPREGSDRRLAALYGWSTVFLSTLPARGATSVILKRGWCHFDFYPRSPRGERQRPQLPAAGQSKISIHAPREGSDRVGQGVLSISDDFYPRSPRGERRVTKSTSRALVVFLSTLPARGATNCLALGFKRVRNFYPRSPRGERQLSSSWIQEGTEFLSTLPARGATRRTTSTTSS